MTERQRHPTQQQQQQQPRNLTNDELAAQLQKCAILVKQNNKTDPLVRQTVHDLTFFLTGKRVSSRTSHTGSATSTTAVVHNHHKTAASSASAGHSSSPTRSVTSTHSTSTTTTVSKPYYSPHHSVKSITGQFVKAMGLGPPLESSNSGGDHSERSRKSIEEKQATSSKNAARAKADLEQLSKGSSASLAGTAVETVHGGGTTDDWCETHFTRGCACQQRTANLAAAGKPAFQRPQNPGSAVLANGWVEQQRRSKMRTVWKEVLASVVEGRQPGEETTLWIQREVVHPVTHKKELEALHQIPVKWLEAVHYSNYSTDHRFVLKVYNLHEDFVFRCENNQEAAQNWVLTLRSIMELHRNNGKKVETALDDNSEWNEFKSRKTPEEEKKQDPTTMQGAGVGPPPGPPPPQHQHAAPQASSPLPPQAPHGSAAQVPPQQPQRPSVAAAPVTSRMTVKELRAIAHGFGVTTVGMERSDLEHLVQQIAAQHASTPVPPHPPQPPPQQQQSASTQHPPPPPTQQPQTSSSGPAPAAATTTTAQVRSANSSVTSVPSEDESASKAAAQHELARRRKLAEESAQARVRSEAAAEQARHEAERRRVLAEESAQARARSEAAEQARQKQQQQEAERRSREEEERQRLERERRQREEEEHRRRVAEQQAAEQRRRQEEQARQQQQQWQQQQQQWQAQQAEAARQRQSEQQRAEQQRRQQEEAYRQWQQPRAGPQPPPPQQPYPPYGHPQQQFHPHQAQFPGQQQQHAHHPPPPPPGGSPINMKYAQMAVQSNTASGTLPTIKHGILVEWALQPPSMQILRPIEVLVTTIHTVFPPKFGVPGHDHFARWKVVTLPEVLSGPGQPDDDKLNKVVKKLRFLLHPDKLPRDLSDEQQYMCKMLWDITHDAFEDHKKKVEELDWMK